MFDVAETDRLLTTTRAVRRRLDLDRPVEREVVLDCLRIAVQAPTASNDQSWRWMVVTDPAKRAALADLYRETASATSTRPGTPSTTRRRHAPTRARTSSLRTSTGCRSW